MRSLGLSTAEIKDAIKKAKDTITSPTDEPDSNKPSEVKGARTRWGLLGIRSRRIKQQNINNGTVSSNDKGDNQRVNGASTSSKFASFRRKSAGTNGLDLTAWSQEVCLDYPKREML